MEKISELIAGMSEAELTEVMDFIGYLKLRQGKVESECVKKVIEDSEEFLGEEGAENQIPRPLKGKPPSSGV